jgi:hypothetical protein
MVCGPNPQLLGGGYPAWHIGKTNPSNSSSGVGSRYNKSLKQSSTYKGSKTATTMTDTRSAGQSDQSRRDRLKKWREAQQKQVQRSTPHVRQPSTAIARSGQESALPRSVARAAPELSRAKRARSGATPQSQRASPPMPRMPMPSTPSFARYLRPATPLSAAKRDRAIAEQVSPSPLLMPYLRPSIAPESGPQLGHD